MMPKMETSDISHRSAFVFKQALRELRESDQHGILEEGSWQEKMVRTFSKFP